MKHIKIYKTISYILFVVLTIVSCSKTESDSEESDRDPRIREISPTQVRAGDELFIFADYLSSVAEENQVLFDDLVVVPVSVSGGLINVIVPEIEPGEVKVSVRKLDKLSNSRPLNILPPIDPVNPNEIIVRNFEDNFNRSNQAQTSNSANIGIGWQILANTPAFTFGIESNQLVGKTGGNIFNHTIFSEEKSGMNVGGADEKYFKFSVDVKKGSGGSGNIVGVTFNVQDEDKNKSYVLRITGGNGLQLLKTTGGLGAGFAVFGSGAENQVNISSGIAIDTYYRMEVSSSVLGVFNIKVTNLSNNIVFLEKTVKETEGIYVGGSAGLFYRGDPTDAYFDNFSLEVLN